MSETEIRFIKNSEIKSFDPDHRERLNFNISRYDKAVIKGKKQFKDLELARQRAYYLKHRILADLESNLLKFESRFTKRGGKVIWAEDAREAVREILKIAKKHNTSSVVKSKSMTTEEIDLNAALEKKKIESIETDLGEYIVQLAGEKPYHIVTPAMHKSKKDIADLFHDKFGLPEESTPEEITAFVRNKLRDKFIKADIGVTGANFLITETGSVCLTENEGNGIMSASFPKVHIVIAGIEKLIPSLEDLDLFWPLLATHGTGQNITVYNSVFSGPKRESEADGPEEMYVILLENNRTEVLRQEKQRVAMCCIRCGACPNGCPIYKSIGGYTYEAVYSGPIGSVITPWLKGLKEYKHLSFASSLCGRCTEVCPVNIPIHELLLYNRNDAVVKGYTTGKEKFTMYLWKKIMLSRGLMDMFGGRTKNLFLGWFFKKQWGASRALPHIPQKSFNRLWREGKVN